jgi:hypothetical protein
MTSTLCGAGIAELSDAIGSQIQILSLFKLFD